MESVVERLARSPSLGLIDRDLSSLWVEEQSARQRFFDGIKDGQKTEFVNGDILLPSPAKLKHVEARKRLTKLFDTRAVIHDLGLVGDEKLLVCLTRNDYMPDVVFSQHPPPWFQGRRERLFRRPLEPARPSKAAKVSGDANAQWRWQRKTNTTQSARFNIRPIE